MQAVLTKELVSHIEAIAYLIQGDSSLHRSRKRVTYTGKEDPP
jgi:hypothetical protein